MNTGDFVWVKAMRSRDKLRPAMLLAIADVNPAHTYMMGVGNHRSMTCWRVVMLDSMLATGEAHMFEADSNQIVRRMTPLEALVWSTLDGD
jgi:hypothetical protein